MTIYDEDNLPFADNADSRLPVVGVFDSSASMMGAKIDALNNGIQKLYSTLNDDVLCRRRVDFAAIRCGGSSAEVVQPMVTINEIVEGRLPSFTASGGTPMEQSLQLALDLVKNRKAILRENGVDYYKPIIIIITDGHFRLSSPTRDRLHASEEKGGHTILPIGVSGADAKSLASTSASGLALMIDDVDFSEMIDFLSNSLKSVSQSTPGEEISIVPPECMRVIKL
mgnify:CR=1 FL=1